MLKLFIASIPILLPFALAPFLIDGGLVPGFILLAIFSVVVWGIVALRAKRNEPIALPHAPVLSSIALAFIVWSGISIFYSVAPADAVFLWVKWLTMAGFGLGLAILLATDERLTPPLLKGLIISALATSCIGVLQLLPHINTIVHTPELTYQITGFFGHKNLLSSWLMLLVPLVVWGMYRLGMIWKLLGGLALVLLLGIILMVQSRSAWVAMALAGLLVGLIFFMGLLVNKPVQHRGPVD